MSLGISELRLSSRMGCQPEREAPTALESNEGPLHWEAVPLGCQPQQRVATHAAFWDAPALESPIPIQRGTIHTALLGLSAKERLAP